MSYNKFERFNWSLQEESMRDSVIKHLQDKYPGKEIEISIKKGGIQMGCVAKVILEDSPPIKYYIKTFSNGTSCRDNNSKYVNPLAKPDLKELIAYKVLEHMGYGAKCEFITTNSTAKNHEHEKEYYLLTQDLGYTKDPEKTKRYTLFNEAKNITAKPITNMLCLDMLIKVLHLHDIHQENFGQITTNNMRQKYQLHDFSVSPYINGFERFFGTWDQILNIENEMIKIKEGTYPCLWSFLDKKGLISINHCDVMTFIQNAITILEAGRPSSVYERKCGFETALDLAFNEIEQFHQDNNLDPRELEKLKEYYMGAYANFKELKELRDLAPESLVRNEIVPYPPNQDTSYGI